MENFIQRRVRRWIRGLKRDSIQRKLDTRTRSAVREWVRQKRYCEPLTMEEVAQSMGVSKEQLSWYFRDRVDQTFLCWRKELRIHEAMSIMQRQPDLSVARIASLVGIGDKRNFRRQFQDVTGMSLQAWRLREQ